MSNKPKTGDKYIIEIEGVYGKQITIPAGVHSMDIPFLPVNPSTLYKIKGFPSVVFTEEDLKKLEKYEERPEKPKIKIGDEVVLPDGRHCAVTRVYTNHRGRWIVGIDGTGSACEALLDEATPTGGRLLSLSALLNNMLLNEAEDAGGE